MREGLLAEFMVDYLYHYIGHWYKWGGDDPLGMDCSGLAIEGLKAVGKVPRGRWDTTAHGLYVHGWERTEIPRVGCLAFWGTEQKVIHVEVVCRLIDAVPYTIGASGGGSRTKTVEDAVRDNAFIKIRPAKPGVLAYVDPFHIEPGGS